MCCFMKKVKFSKAGAISGKNKIWTLKNRFSSGKMVYLYVHASLHWGYAEKSDTQKSGYLPVTRIPWIQTLQGKAESWGCTQWVHV